VFQLSVVSPCASSLAVLGKWIKILQIKYLLLGVSRLDQELFSLHLNMAKFAVFLSDYRPWILCAVSATAYSHVLSQGWNSFHQIPLLLGKHLLIVLSIWAVYTSILYPRFFSPLRHLPQPEVSNGWCRDDRRLWLTKRFTRMQSS
jgi:hypothetical protein